MTSWCWKRTSPLCVSIALTLSVIACGGKNVKRTQKPGTSSNQQPKEWELDEWQTEQQWVLFSKDRCVTGPFVVDVPERKNKFGRRFTIEVFGERQLPMDTAHWRVRDSSLNPLNTPKNSLNTWGGQDIGDHSACRAEEESANAAASTAPTRSTAKGIRKQSGASLNPSGDGRGNAKVEMEFPTLDFYTGSIPEKRQQATANAWFPQGNPNYYGIDDIRTWRVDLSDTRIDGSEAFRVKFWFHRPVDMQGVVIRFRDQVLTPTGSLEEYRANFAARVADVKMRKEEERAKRKRAKSKPGAARATRATTKKGASAYGKVPPPPKKEVVPKAPSENVRWLPGYWRWHAEFEGFIWIDGTFVVDADATAEAAVTAEPSSDSQVESEIEHTREVSVSLPPKPEPRREKIPPPPNVRGAVWVAGFWELRDDAWQWVSGKWQVPRQRGARFRAPSIEVRGKVKIYIPGGWTFGR